MALDKLQKEMDHEHQRARRVTGTDPDSVMAMLPTEITARRQRTIAWELTACEQMNAGKLMSLTHELRCLESQIPVLEAGLKAMPIRVTNPRCLQSEEVEEENVTSEFEQGECIKAAARMLSLCGECCCARTARPIGRGRVDWSLWSGRLCVGDI